jgi:hypothetical protein
MPAVVVIIVAVLVLAAIATAAEASMVPEPTGGYSDAIKRLASAIAFAEGFGIPGAIPTRANNPGDLVIPGWTGGQLGAEKISVFESPAEGWNRLYRQLWLIQSGKSSVYTVNMTIAQMAARWTATEPNHWASNVVSYLVNHGRSDTTIQTTIGSVLA